MGMGYGEHRSWTDINVRVPRFKNSPTVPYQLLFLVYTENLIQFVFIQIV